ncbi:uncharacterized protein PgNI_00522 [Pyricularia grisea]|uniref:Uncharacterized protein n=1 Tax=Pyricularia grisea TaxID=148305 RepID=A0A6P8BIW8_PYRGI|nr:uncharacterized protein PgNI_00522 [Pyricularia grisea]TLD16728.1 hypothetical protein PgNI_00522 [Pyricularia grisea]
MCKCIRVIHFCPLCMTLLRKRFAYNYICDGAPCGNQVIEDQIAGTDENICEDCELYYWMRKGRGKRGRRIRRASA